MFFKSQLKDDIKESKKKHMYGKGTLKRNIHIMNKDTTRIDLTVQIEIMQWTRHSQVDNAGNRRRGEGNDARKKETINKGWIGAHESARKSEHRHSSTKMQNKQTHG